MCGATSYPQPRHKLRILARPCSAVPSRAEPCLALGLLKVRPS